LSFVRLSWDRITDKVAINWQGFVYVQLQLKFDFSSSLISGHGFKLLLF